MAVVSDVLRLPEPQAAPFSGWSFLWRPALLGFLALASIAVGSSFTNSPFKLDNPGTWFFGVPTHPVQPFAPTNSSTMLLGITLVYGGLILLVRVWIRMANVARQHPDAPLRPLRWVLALWTLPMLVIAPIFSRDVFSYAAQGEAVTRGINVYATGPYVLGSTPYTAPIDHVWRWVPRALRPALLEARRMDRAAHRAPRAVVGGRVAAPRGPCRRHPRRLGAGAR